MPTTSTIDPMLPPEPGPSASGAPALPTLDELRHIPTGERRVYRGVEWGFYLRLHEVIGERPGFRIAFDGMDIEIMTIGPFHDAVKSFGFRLVDVITEELEIPSASTGSTTWIRPEIQRGIEADQSFHFAADKIAAVRAAMARRSNDVADIPNPDLALEIDISPPQVDRPSIYAALRVPEIWRFRESGVTVERLTEQETYVEVEQSGLLPIRAVEIARWVLQEDRSNLLDWKRRLRAWVRDELAGRMNP